MPLPHIHAVIIEGGIHQQLLSPVRVAFDLE